MKELTVIQQQEILGKPLTVYGDFENPWLQNGLSIVKW